MCRVSGSKTFMPSNLGISLVIRDRRGKVTIRSDLTGDFRPSNPEARNTLMLEPD